MNKLEETLATILEKALSLAEQTGEFAMEQAPELLQEFFMWHTATAILGIILSLSLAYALHKIIKYFSNEVNDKGVYIFEMFQIIPFVILCINTYELIYVLVAPKLYLIEYFIK